MRNDLIDKVEYSFCKPVEPEQRVRSLERNVEPPRIEERAKYARNLIAPDEKTGGFRRSRPKGALLVLR